MVFLDRTVILLGHCRLVDKPFMGKGGGRYFLTLLASTVLNARAGPKSGHSRSKSWGRSEEIWPHNKHLNARLQKILAALHDTVLMRRYLLVAIGGGIGSLMRFAIAQWVSSMSVWTPLTILIINVSGCFVISFLNFVSDPSGDIYLGPYSRLFLLVGVCGGYTTFSSFSLISFNAARHGAFSDLWFNIGLSHVLCLLSVWVGAIVAAPFPHASRAVLRALRS